MPASPARRSRPAEQADGKSQFLPHTNKVGKGSAAIGAAPEGKGVGSLLRGPLPACCCPGSSLTRHAPAARQCAEAGGLGGSVRRGDGAAGNKRPPRELPGAGVDRAGRGHGRKPARRPQPRGAPASRATRQLSPTRALTRTYSESHGHGAARTPCHAHAPCGTRTGSSPTCHVTHTLRVTRTLTPTHSRCLSLSRALPPAGKHASSHTSAASHPDTRRGARTQPHVPSVTPGLCHRATRTHTDPHMRSHTRRVSHAGTRTLPVSLPERSQLATHIVSQALAAADIHTRSRTPAQAATRACRNPHMRVPPLAPPATPPRNAEPPPITTVAAGGPGRTAPAPCVRVCACGKPEELPCGPFGSAPPPPPGQLRGPGPEQLVFVPTRRPGGRGRGGRKGQPALRRAARGREHRGARSPRGAGQRRGLHLPPGIPAPRGHPRARSSFAVTLFLLLCPRLMLRLRSGPREGGPGGGSVVRSAAAMCVLPESAGERPTAPEARAEVAVDLLADLRATWPGGRPGLFITGGRTQSLSPSPSASRGYFVPAVQTIFNLYPLP